MNASTGVWLGLDVGTRDLGVAVGNELTGRARPLKTLAMQPENLLWAALDALVARYANPGGLHLAQAHGLSPSTVSRLMAVLKMSRALQQLVDAGMRLQTAARIHARGPSESARIVRGLNAGNSLRSLLGEAKPRAPRAPQRGARKPREAFAARLVEARLRLRLTQEQFGAGLGVGQSTVGSWETAKALPEVETLIRIADHLDVSIDWLLGREDRPERLRSEYRSAR